MIQKVSKLFVNKPFGIIRRNCLYPVPGGKEAIGTGLDRAGLLAPDPGNRFLGFPALSWILSFFLLGWAFSCRNQVVVYPAPEGENLYDGYTLKAGGVPVPVHACRVSAIPFNQVWPGYQRPVEQTELAGFANWDMKKSVKVEVTAGQDIDSVVVRPLSLGIIPEVKGNKISFVADSIIPMVVEINGYHHALHLFPNPHEKNIPVRSTSRLRYFGPGVHDVGILDLQSNDTVYISGSAVVYGVIRASEADNICIRGRGILDGSRIPRSNLPYIGQGCITIFGSDNITIEGIVLRDPNRWCMNLFGCSNARISNVKIVGLWRYNTDGISANNSRNVLIENCFVRSYDDALEVKGVTGWNTVPAQNVRFKNCVVWCDWGRSMGITSETLAPFIENISFEDCNLIRISSTAMAITHKNHAAIRNIRFENINMETDAQIPRQMIQQSKDSKFIVNFREKFCPALIVVTIRGNISPAKELEAGTIDGLLFKNIKVTGCTDAGSSFMGMDAEHAISNVTIKNLQFNGKVMDDLKQANVTVGPFVKEVHIEK